MKEFTVSRLQKTKPPKRYPSSRMKIVLIGCSDTQEGMKNVKEGSEKVGLKLNIRKAKVMASGPITSWQIDGETMETVTDYFLGLQNHCIC